jgi:hypothetical protein
MRHHLRKIKDLYARGGLLQTAESVIRYVPIELNNLFFRLSYGSGTEVMSEDWDNLFILDGCRYDLYQSCDLPVDGRLESRISLGSSSEEFLEQNFSGNKYHDTVYVNANPFIPRFDLDEGNFHAVVDCLGEWDADLQTIPPEPVADAAQRAFNNFPNKRIIVHFMQPHAPFIGKKGRTLAGGEGWTVNKENSGKKQTIWNTLRDNPESVEIKDFWEAYEENLQIVLNEVKPLIENWNGKSVVTADHGNLVGERLSPIPTKKKFGHPYGVHTKELVKVPWFVVNGSRRREIIEDSPVDQESVRDERIEEHLEDLGYI